MALTTNVLSVAAIGAGVGGAGWWWTRRQKGASQEELFNNWVAGSEELDENVKQWLVQLSDDEIEQLVAQLAEHCADVGMELDWLFSDQLTHDDLKKALRGTVMAYLMSRMTAARAAEQAQAFKAYQAFVQNPKKHEELGRKLYAKLVDQGIITVSTVELLETSSKKRQQHVVTTLAQSANDNPIAFHQSLQSVVLEVPT